MVPLIAVAVAVGYLLLVVVLAGVVVRRWFRLPRGERPRTGP